VKKKARPSGREEAGRRSNDGSAKAARLVSTGYGRLGGPEACFGRPRKPSSARPRSRPRPRAPGGRGADPRRDGATPVGGEAGPPARGRVHASGRQVHHAPSDPVRAARLGADAHPRRQHGEDCARSSAAAVALGARVDFRSRLARDGHFGRVASGLRTARLRQLRHHAAPARGHRGERPGSTRAHRRCRLCRAGRCAASPEPLGRMGARLEGTARSAHRRSDVHGANLHGIDYEGPHGERPGRRRARCSRALPPAAPRASRSRGRPAITPNACCRIRRGARAGQPGARRARRCA
jgi:hypothetical protein